MHAAAGGDWAKRVKAAGLSGWPQTFETAETRAELKLARWLTKSLIKDIDGEHPRDLWKWFNVLDFKRVTHAPRT